VAKEAAGETRGPPWKVAEAKTAGKPKGWAFNALQMHREMELLQKWKDEAMGILGQMQGDMDFAHQQYRQKLEHNQRLQEKLEWMGHQAKAVLAGMPPPGEVGREERGAGPDDHPNLASLFGGACSDPLPMVPGTRVDWLGGSSGSRLGLGGESPIGFGIGGARSSSCDVLPSGPDVPERPDLPSQPRVAESRGTAELRATSDRGVSCKEHHSRGPIDGPFYSAHCAWRDCEQRPQRGRHLSHNAARGRGYTTGQSTPGATRRRRCCRNPGRSPAVAVPLRGPTRAASVGRPAQRYFGN